jgi:hypothetical protein
MTRPFARLAVFAAATVIAASAASAGLTPDQRRSAAQALEVREFSVQDLVPKVAPDGSMRVELLLGDRAATLLLEPHSIRAAGFALVEVGADGSAVALPGGPVTTYRGTIEDDPDSRVAAGFAGGRLTAWIDTGEAVWMTQSIADALPEAAPGQTAVFAADDIDMSRWFCAVEDAAPFPGGDVGDGGVAPRGTSACPTRVVTLEMTADRAFSILHGAFVQSRIETMVNIVSAIYEDNFSMQIELIGIRTFASTDPWNVPDDGTGSVDPNDLLDAFSDFIGASGPIGGGDRDFAHLASGREFVGSTVGLAGVGTLCSSPAATGIDQWNGLNLPFNAGILAHEMGHNCGAQHDGSGNACPTTGFIMASGICGNCGPLPDRFSACSVAYITPNLSRPCVAQLPPALGSFGAVNDSVTLPRGTAHLIDVTANDLVCVDGQRVQIGALTLSAGTSAAGFPISVVPGAGPEGRDMIDYAPNPNFTGSDNFTYTLVNGAQSANALVTINVSAGVTTPLCDCDCFMEYRDDPGPSSAIFFGPTTPVNWLNQFDVRAGGDQILQVSVHSLLGPAGVNVRFVIWDDPNNDGDPHDAVPIATSPIVALNQTGETRYTFPPTDVGAPGDSFFVGAAYASGQFFIGSSNQPNTDGRSWLSIGSTNLGQNFQTQATDDHLVIRAVGGEGIVDCNENQIPDVCDVASFIRPDVNGNGVPDECDPPPAECPCEFDGDAGQVNVFDLLAYLDAWFPGAPAADLDGQPGVNVFDLLAYLDCWFPASAGDPCHG